MLLFKNVQRLLDDIDKLLAIVSFKNNDIEQGIKYFEDYLSTLQSRIEQNSNIDLLVNEKNDTIKVYKAFLLDAAKRNFASKNWLTCAKCCKLLIKYNSREHEVYKHAALCFRELKDYRMALKLLEIYEKLEPADHLSLVYKAECYYSLDNEKYAQTAISLYKKFLEFNPNDAQVYNAIGNIYAGTIDFKESNVERQMFYYNKALEYAPNQCDIMRNIHLSLLKQGNLEASIKVYDEIYKLYGSRFDHDCYFDYAAFQIYIGNFKRGWDYLDHRFLKEHGATYYPKIDKPLWDGYRNIKSKTLLVHCEQGFGDNIMYVRFAKCMKKYAKKVVVRVPDELVELFTESDLGVPVYSLKTPLSEIPFDYHIPMLSTPRVYKISPTNIPDTQGYLTVDRKRVEAYNYSYINTTKFKIGVCLEGASHGVRELRDIDWSCLDLLSKNKKIQLYCLKDTLTENDFKAILPDVDIVCLGKTFNSFADTAASIKNMDLIITTDNVILNLSGALGVKTLGLFNLQHEYRWHALEKGTVIWYDSVVPIVAKKHNDWSYVIDEIVKYVNEVTGYSEN